MEILKTSALVAFGAVGALAMVVQGIDLVDSRVQAGHSRQARAEVVCSSLKGVPTWRGETVGPLTIVPGRGWAFTAASGKRVTGQEVCDVLALEDRP